MISFFNFIYWFIKARYLWKFKSSNNLLAHQQKQLKKYFEKLKVLGKFNNLTFDEFKLLPQINKKKFIENFKEYNLESLTYDECVNFAKKQEKERNFNQMLRGASVGLSSGTSGISGVFVTTKKEQIKWAAIILGKMLPMGLILKNILQFKKTKILLILRNNNNLYKALNGLFVKFDYIDLVKDSDSYINKLNYLQPDILVAPATVLLNLAHQKVKYGSLSINPQMIVSVAEVLESKEFISKAFNQQIKEIYQATEGFLAYTCKHNSIHLNESFLIIENNWLDKKRFNPVITDFSRLTQTIVKYKHDDILILSEQTCKCGSAERILSNIVGRNDEVIKIEDKVIFPDQIRQLFFTLETQVENYLVEYSNEYKLINIYFMPYSQEAKNQIESGLIKLINKNIKLYFNPYQMNLIKSTKNIRIRNIK